MPNVRSFAAPSDSDGSEEQKQQHQQEQHQKQEEEKREQEQEANEISAPTSSLTSTHAPTLRWNLSSVMNTDVDGEMNVNHAYAKIVHLEQVYKDALEALEAAEPLEPLNLDLNIDCTHLPKESPLHKAKRFMLSYHQDRAHHGRFAIPQISNSTSIPANLVFSVENPLRYIQEHLSYRTKKEYSKEIVVALPDLCSRMPRATEQTQYISRVLGGMHMSHLHVGSLSNTGDESRTVIVEVTPDTHQALHSLGLIILEEREKLPKFTTNVQIQRRDLDLLQAILARSNSISDPLVSNLVKLIDIAVEFMRKERPHPHLVLMASGVQTQYIASAVDAWLDLSTSDNVSLRGVELRNRGFDQESARFLLQKAVTVLTMGCLCRSFPEGPKYIHVSTYDDELVQTFGIPRKRKGQVEEIQGGIFLRALSPYCSAKTTSTFDETNQLFQSDAHNCLACSTHFIYLTLRINGLSTFLELFEIGRRPAPVYDIQKSLYALNYDNDAGELLLPQDELVWAVIRATRATRWLWWPSMVDEDLPASEYAEATIEEHFGYGVYEEITEPIQ